MSALLGIPYSQYSMTETGIYPGPELIRVFEINKLLAKWAQSEKETLESDRNDPTVLRLVQRSQEFSLVDCLRHGFNATFIFRPANL